VQPHVQGDVCVFACQHGGVVNWVCACVQACVQACVGVWWSGVRVCGCACVRAGVRVCGCAGVSGSECE
jgi:hypothetical protein